MHLSPQTPPLTSPGKRQHCCHFPAENHVGECLVFYIQRLGANSLLSGCRIVHQLQNVS